MPTTKRQLRQQIAELEQQLADKQAKLDNCRDRVATLREKLADCEDGDTPLPTPSLAIDAVVVENSTPTVTFSGGIAPHEVQLNGWSSWREVTSPYTFPQPIDPGTRTVYVRDSEGTVVSQDFVIDAPEPEPEPTRLFAADAPWNTKILNSSRAPATELVDHGSVTDSIIVNPDGSWDYSHPIFYAKASDPLLEVQLSTNWDGGHVQGRKIHVPANATAATGGDAHLTVIQPDSGDLPNTSVGFYDVTEIGSGFVKAKSAGYSDLATGDGTDLGNTTAAGFNNAAGVITAQELEDGLIPHALFLVTNCTTGDAIYPAQPGTTAVRCGTTRYPTNAGLPPLGTRLQLDPSYDISGFPAGQQIILRALQEYGGLIGDTGMYSRARIFGTGTESPESGGQLLEQFCERAVAEGWAYKGSNGSSTYWALDFGKGVDWANNLKIATEPEQTDPFIGMRLRKSLNQLSDWDSDFLAGSVGTIKQTAEGISFSAPGSTDQTRCEVQYHNTSVMAPIPGTFGYRYSVKFPSGASLGEDNPSQKSYSRSGLPDKIDYPGTNNFNQHHSDQSCYTGGLKVDNSGRLYVSISGGKTTSFSSSCDQYYEVCHRTDFYFPRDEFVKIEQVVYWHEANGSWTVWANDEVVFDISGVPTSGEHDDPKDPATKQKFRLGLYGRPTTPNGFKMVARNIEVWTP